MSVATTIEWTDTTWNPVRGCSRVSEGCRNCYAERQAVRAVGGRMAGFVRSTPEGPRWTGQVDLVPEKLAEPLGWKKPRRVFVNSMSDLFHEALSDDAIAAVFGVMAAAPQHTFQVLTKRPERMRRFLAQRDPWSAFKAAARSHGVAAPKSVPESVDWSRDPLPNVWLGASVEDQASADERIPQLLATPAAVRFISAEPLLGPVDLWSARYKFPSGHIGGIGNWGEEPRIHWCIVGGESGPRARPCNIDWIGSIVTQCKAAGVACFVKQVGAQPVVFLPPTGAPDDGGDMVSICLRDRKGGDPAEWPEDLRVREFPEPRP